MSFWVGLFFITLLISFAYPSFAGTNELISQEIDSYKKGDYNQVLLIGRQILTKNPEDAFARFYCAEALVQLGRKKEAAQEYNHCYNTSSDASLKSYCVQALKNLSTLQDGSTGGRGATAAGAATTGSKAQNGETLKASGVPEASPGAQKTLSRKAQILEDGAKQVAFQRQLADIAIEKANEKAAEALESIPRYMNINSIQPIPNPDYQTAKEQGEEEVKAETTKINDTFKREEARIIETYKKRAAGYD